MWNILGIKDQLFINKCNELTAIMRIKITHSLCWNVSVALVMLRLANTYIWNNRLGSGELVNLSIRNECEIRCDGGHDKNATIESWLHDRPQLSHPVPICHKNALNLILRSANIYVNLICYERNHGKNRILHVTRERGRDRGYLFNWIRVVFSRRLVYMQTDILWFLRFRVRETGSDALSLFTLLKNSMHVEQILGDVALWFAILRFATLLRLKRITVLQAGNFIPSRILCDAHSF